jgi:hypothetical protein
MSGFDEPSDRLKGAWLAVRSEWHDAKEHWHDAIADTFERNVWQQWEEQVPQMLMRLDDLDQILQQALERTA